MEEALLFSTDAAPLWTWDGGLSASAACLDACLFEYLFEYLFVWTFICLNIYLFTRLVNYLFGDLFDCLLDWLFDCLISWLTGFCCCLIWFILCIYSISLTLFNPIMLYSIYSTPSLSFFRFLSFFFFSSTPTQPACVCTAGRGGWPSTPSATAWNSPAQPHWRPSSHSRRWGGGGEGRERERGEYEWEKGSEGEEEESECEWVNVSMCVNAMCYLMRWVRGREIDWEKEGGIEIEIDREMVRERERICVWMKMVIEMIRVYMICILVHTCVHIGINVFSVRNFYASFILFLSFSLSQKRNKLQFKSSKYFAWLLLLLSFYFKFANYIDNHISNFIFK